MEAICLKAKNLHDKIVDEVLPLFAEKLKQEGVISEYNRRPFRIPLFQNESPYEIRPDLVLVLPNGQTIVTEITNPKDRKRFIGEIAYTQVLWNLQKIAAAVLFVLKYAGANKRMFEAPIISKTIGTMPNRRMLFTWSSEEDVNYHNLKTFLQNMLQKDGAL